MPRRRTIYACLLAGLVARLVALPLPGTLDVSVWKIWAFAAATGDPARVYGTANQTERRLLRYEGRRAVVDYPPGAVYVLGLVGRAYLWWDPGFHNGPLLNAAIKLPGTAADLAAAVLLVWIGARHGLVERGWRLALAWWLNPAVVLDGAVLGYLDPWLSLPMLGAVVAASAGLAEAAGGFLAAASLLKAQAVLLAPLVILTIVTRGGWPALGRAAAAGGAVIALAIAPTLLAGGGPTLLAAMESLTRHDLLSGNAANVWWLVTWIFRAGYEAGLGWGEALLVPVRILAVSTIEELGFPNPRPAGLLLTALAWAWTLWRLRGGGSLWSWAAGGALMVHAYFMLAVQVHENHLYLALPLATLAAVGLPVYTRVVVVLSAMFAANLFLFYGLGQGLLDELPRGFTGVDASVVLAAVGLVAFLWHVRMFARLSDHSAIV